MELVTKISQILKSQQVREQLAKIAGAICVLSVLEGRAPKEGETSPFQFRSPSTNLGISYILRELIIKRLPSPPVIEASDLTIPFLTALDENGRDWDYARFCQDFCNQLSKLTLGWHRSAPTSAGSGSFAAGQDSEIVYGFAPVPIYKSESGFEVFIIAVLPESVGTGHHVPKQHRAMIQVYGTCTQEAFTTALEEITTATGSLLKSGELLANQRFFTDACAEKDLAGMFAGPTVATLIEDGKIGLHFSFVPDCLAAYFAEAPRKDSVLRRIKNAIRLLVQADAQSDTSIGLALSVAAIEALVCCNGSDLANMFAEHIAALLEPDPRYRSAAVRWAQKVYGLRSEVLHGTGFDVGIMDIDHARMLAAAVLKAMIERRTFVRRMGDNDESPADLLRELRDDLYTPGQLTGVEDSPVASLWRDSNTGGGA